MGLKLNGIIVTIIASVVVLSFPSEIFSEMQEYDVKKPENKWVNDWKPSDRSLMYLKNEKIMKDSLKNEKLSYLNPRAFILDLWLQNIKL